MKNQKRRFAGSAARATAASRKATDNPNSLGPLSGDYGAIHTAADSATTMRAMAASAAAAIMRTTSAIPIR